MKILICDDDASTRFAVRRLLTRQIDCVVVECHDGLEALRQLERDPADLMVLDIEMPGLSGVEVLTAVRSSAALKHLPVVMMSRERRETVVLALVRLGIDGYVLKPLRTDKVLAAIEPLLDRMARRSASQSLDAACVDPDAPVLLVDGEADYRRFFAEHARVLGHVEDAVSGAAALAHFKREPAGLVFLGGHLGVLNRGLVVPKLRAMAASRPSRLVALAEPGCEGEDIAGCDEVIERSRDPVKLRAALRRFSKMPGLGEACTVLVGDLQDCLVNGARQVCGMMLDTAVRLVEGPAISEPMVGVTIVLAVQQQPRLALTLQVSVRSAKWMAGRMLGQPIERCTNDDCEAAVTELSNLIGWRLRECFEHRSIPCECANPRIDWAPAAWEADIVDRPGLRVQLEAADIDMRLLVGVDACSESLAARPRHQEEPPSLHAQGT